MPIQSFVQAISPVCVRTGIEFGSSPTGRCAIGRSARHDEVSTLRSSTFWRTDMGKYIFAWILGVPAVLLVGIYVVSHL